MKLYEYQAHALFAEHGLPSLKGFVASSAAEASDRMSADRTSADGAAASGAPSFPVVVKAQVQTGGRGKAGGIRFAENAAELEAEAARVLGLTINGLPVKKVFVTEKVSVAREMYLSVALDRKEKCPVVVFCADGGMEINEIADAHPEKIVKLHLRGETELKPFMVQYLVDKSGLAASFKAPLGALASSLLSLFFARNAMLVEVNPLAVTSSGELLCLDGKIDVDDNALYKFDDLRAARDEMEADPLILEARGWDFLYIPVREDGDIAVISNGSGMLMSSIDLISQKGYAVHSVLDLGGGATAERIKEAVRIVLSESKVRLLFVNIFGGITRCDEIAKGIAGSWDAVKSKKLVLRLEGTNKEEGAAIVRGLNPDIYLADDLVDGVERIVKEMGR